MGVVAGIGGIAAVAVLATGLENPLCFLMCVCVGGWMCEGSLGWMEGRSWGGGGVGVVEEERKDGAQNERELAPDGESDGDEE